MLYVKLYVREKITYTYSASVIRSGITDPLNSLRNFTRIEPKIEPVCTHTGEKGFLQEGHYMHVAFYKGESSIFSQVSS